MLKAPYKMEDIKAIILALGIRIQDEDERFVERCSNLKIFEFIKQCITAILRLMNKTDSIKSLEITSRIYAKLLRLSPEVSGNIFDCEICGQSCSEGSKLRRHMLVHSKLKEFECEVCGKQFSLRHNLRTHMRTHQGIKLYDCPACDSSFIQLSNLKFHMKIKNHDYN